MNTAQTAAPNPATAANLTTAPLLEILPRHAATAIAAAATGSSSACVYATVIDTAHAAASIVQGLPSLALMHAATPHSAPVASKASVGYCFNCADCTIMKLEAAAIAAAGIRNRLPITLPA
jgi:hypothetical protein